MDEGRRSIRRLLARRVAVAAIVLGVVFGVIAFFFERQRVADLVIDRALVGTARFNAQIHDTLDAPGPLS